MEKKKKEYIKIIILTVIVTILLISVIFSSSISIAIKKMLFKTGVKICDDELVVHFVDVGQGDASIIIFPNGQTMMIDAGPKGAENELVEYIRNNITSGGNNQVIDYLILTHPDTDHSGGMCAVFKNFDVKHFYRPNIASISEDVNDFIAVCDINEYKEVINTSIDEQGLETNIINQNYTLNIGDVKVEIFAPLRAYSTTNSMSPVIKVTYLGQSFLFAGDIQMDAEHDMLVYYSSQLDADVLKVAHHGSNTSSSEQFIAQVSPQYAVISVGSANSYGHPSYETVVTLQKHKVQIIKTYDNIVRFSLGDQGLELLDRDIVISKVFVEWKVIALILSTILVAVELVFIIKPIIDRKKLFMD